MEDMDDATRIGRAPGHLDTRVDDEVVVLSLRQGRYFGFDDIGSFVWEAIGEPLSLGELVGLLAARYEAPVAVIRRDMVPFLRELHGQGLVTLEPA